MKADRSAAEERFRIVFSHLGAVAAYARRRGSRDADAIAAEVMTIAWRRLADVPLDDPRPWLFATARNLVLADARRSSRTVVSDGIEPKYDTPAPQLLELDPELGEALRSLSPLDREALLLVAWEDLTPARRRARSGSSPRLSGCASCRARRRLKAKLNSSRGEALLEMETT